MTLEKVSDRKQLFDECVGVSSRTFFYFLFASFSIKYIQGLVTT